MEQHQMPTVKAKNRAEAEEELKRLPKNRKTRRMFPKHRTSPLQAHGSARVRSGVRTGSTPHFNLWMADLKLKSALQKTSLSKLADHTHPGALCRSAFALLFNAGIRNVYALTQADVADLLRVNGVGVKKLEAVEAYLLKNNVKTRWTVAA